MNRAISVVELLDGFVASLNLLLLFYECVVNKTLNLRPGLIDVLCLILRLVLRKLLPSLIGGMMVFVRLLV